MVDDSKRNLGDFWADIARDFAAEQGRWNYTLDELARWAIDTERFQADPTDIVKLAKRQAREALGRRKMIDKQGREIREFICVEQAKQQPLWAETRAATWEFKIAFVEEQKTRLKQDWKQLQAFVDSCNDNCRPEGYPMIQLDFSFLDEDNEGGAA
jgi:hypothetical protein